MFKSILKILSICAILIISGCSFKELNLGGSKTYPQYGGTGTSQIPTLGQVLVGVSGGVYAPQATSTLSISPYNGEFQAGYFTATSTSASSTFPMIVGSQSTGGNLWLGSTNNSTKGKILFGTSAYDEVNNRLGIGTIPISSSPKFYVKNQEAGTTLSFVPTIGDAVAGGTAHKSGGIGGSFASEIYNTVSSAADVGGVSGSADFKGTAAHTGEIYGGKYYVNHISASLASNLIGLSGKVTVNSGGATDAFGVKGVVQTLGDGAPANTNLYGIYGLVDFSIAEFEGGSTINAYGIYAAITKTDTAHTLTNAYGIYVLGVAGATNNYGIVLDGDGVGADLVLGDGQDAKIYYDGTDLIIDPDVVGTGVVHIAQTATATGTVAATIGNIYTGGTAAQTEWLKVKVNGNVRYIPLWQ